MLTFPAELEEIKVTDMLLDVEEAVREVEDAAADAGREGVDDVRDAMGLEGTAPVDGGMLGLRGELLLPEGPLEAGRGADDAEPDC